VSRGLRHEGFAVDEAADGEQALREAAVWDYDAIVLDVLLPGRDGFEVCRALRERGCWAPVLMLTARGRVADRIGGLDAGADDYLIKPFDFGELLARLRALLRRAPAERPARLEVGDLVVDPATHAVSRAGTRVELSAREFAVLEYLARHPGEAVSRTRLIEHVWDRNFYGSGNIVDVYVGYLRRKLELPFGRPLIRTLRGVGYVLEP
jgi:two-component system OmpR family response regulator